MPTGEQLLLQQRRRLRGKSRQLFDAFSRLFKAPGEQRRSGDQADQLRRAGQQLRTLLLVQAQQQEHRLLFEQMLETEVLQQADRDFIFFGEQGLFERRFPQLFGGEPLARAPMPGTPGRPLFIAHQLREWRKNLQPVRRVLPGLDKAAEFLQRLQALRAFTGAEQVLAQPRIEARQMREYTPGFGEFGAEAGEQFVLQIIEQGVRSAVQRVVARPVAFVQQRNAHTGAPAATEADDFARGNVRFGGCQVLQQRGNFRLIEGQRRALAVIQIIVE